MGLFIFTELGLASRVVQSTIGCMNLEGKACLEVKIGESLEKMIEETKLDKQERLDESLRVHEE